MLKQKQKSHDSLFITIIYNQFSKIFSFSLSLIDALDSLVVLGELDEFERAVQLVINNVRFDSNFVVSVFETNIRVVGGLISGNSSLSFI